MSHSGYQSPSPADVRWILFDFGGVLAEEGFHNALAELSERYGQPPDALPRLAMDAVYASGYVTGHGSEHDFWNLLRQRFPFTESESDVSAEILRRFILRKPMLDLVDALRKRGYLTAILSDQTDWLERLDQRDHFFSHFDRIFNSYYLGKGKRDPGLFDDVLAALTIKPSQAIFIDDNPENISRAESRGLYGILFENAGDLFSMLATLLDIPVDRLVQELGGRRPLQTE